MTPIELLLASAHRATRVDEAKNLYQQILQLDPDHFTANQRLAWLAEDCGEFAGAIALHRRCIAIQPASARAHLNLGLCLKGTGDFVNALAMFRRATELDSNYSIAFCNLGLLLEEQGDQPGAIAALTRAAQLAPDSAFIAYHHAAISGAAPPAVCPPEYLLPLFDGYAEQFDVHLFQRLDYQGPKLLADIVADHGPPKPWDVLDLGCGTGMSAVPFRGVARSITGVDLSLKMLQLASRRLTPSGQRVYDTLLHSDILTALQQRPASSDVILAADVFIYVGDIAPVFTAARRSLRPGGLFAFTTESFDGPDDYQLAGTRRYAQSPRYVESVATGSGFEVIQTHRTFLRQGEGGQPVTGDVYLLEAGAKP